MYSNYITTLHLTIVYVLLLHTAIEPGGDATRFQAEDAWTDEIIPPDYGRDYNSGVALSGVVSYTMTTKQ